MNEKKIEALKNNPEVSFSCECGVDVDSAGDKADACRGTSASMTSETFADWENEHIKMLEEYPEKFLIKHYISIAWLKKR